MRKKLYPAFTGISNTFNIKRSRGGIADIEFIIQFILLLDVKNYSHNKSKTVDKIISSLLKDKYFTDLGVLKDNFLFFKKVTMANQIIFRNTSSSLSLDKNKLLPISNFMNFDSAEDLQETLTKIIKSNNSLFEKYLAGEN